MMRIKNNVRLVAILKTPVVWIGVFAAILYSSWPLGFFLNPNVARSAFASQLEATGQPYNWLFIALDILSGLALLVGGSLQFLKSKNLITRLCVVGYMIFAVLIIVAALVPFNCNSLSASCTNVAHSPLIIIHGSASIISAVFLLASIVLALMQLLYKRVFRWFNTVPMFLIACWCLIGFSALFLDKYRHRADENIVQYAFITICSLSLMLSVVLIEHLSTESSKEDSSQLSS